MGSCDYHKYIACQRDWQSLSNKNNKLEYAKYMLEKYPKPKNWDCVSFSNEVYFGWGPQHQLQIIEKPGK